MLGLDDLLALPTITGHPQLAKLRLTEGLPRGPGVYLFRDVGGRVLYVGKATNLRARVRSYFSGDDRRKVGPLLRETATVDHVPTAGVLEAGVLEVRLIHRHLPRFNRQATTWHRYAYLTLTRERFPRLSVGRTPRPDALVCLGPLPSTKTARLVAEAVQTVVPLRRCTARPSLRSPRPAPCTAAQLGVSTCPCSGQVDEATYAAIVGTALTGLTDDPLVLLDPLTRRIRGLADAQRFEEAADVRDRAGALAASLVRQRRLDGLRRAGRVLLQVGDGGAELAGGRLVRTWHGTDPPGSLVPPDPVPVPTVAAARRLEPLPAALADELACVAGWLDRDAGRVRILDCEGELASRLPLVPDFTPMRGPMDARYSS